MRIYPFSIFYYEIKYQKRKDGINTDPMQYIHYHNTYCQIWKNKYGTDLER